MRFYSGNSVVVYIEGIRVISSFFFFYKKLLSVKTYSQVKTDSQTKTFKRENPLTSRGKLTQRKQANKTSKAAFFVRTKTFEGVKVLCV